MDIRRTTRNSDDTLLGVYGFTRVSEVIEVEGNSIYSTSIFRCHDNCGCQVGMLKVVVMYSIPCDCGHDECPDKSGYNVFDVVSVVRGVYVVHWDDIELHNIELNGSW